LVFTSWKQWTIANRTLALTQRAYVEFNGVSFAIVDTEPTQMSYWLRNTGRTVAHIKRREAHLLFSASAPANIYNPVSKPSVHDADLAAIGPDQSFGGVEDLEPEMMEAVSGDPFSNERLWLHGFTDYYDTFGQYHVTAWCRYWVPGVSYVQNIDLAYPPDPGLNYAT
jgi:hypothetical protein